MLMMVRSYEVCSETTSIPTNPRTTRPVGYAFVDVSTPSEAERAVNELNGKSIMDRKVSVQLARKPEESAAAATSNTNGEAAEGEAGRKRSSNRGRGRGRGNRRGPRSNRVSILITPPHQKNHTDMDCKTGEEGAEDAAAGDEPTNVTGQVIPLTDTTNEAGATTEGGETSKKNRRPREPREPRPQRQRGPPEDGVPSKNKVMVANLPFDLKEEKVRNSTFCIYFATPVLARPSALVTHPELHIPLTSHSLRQQGFYFISLFAFSCLPTRPITTFKQQC